MLLNRADVCSPEVMWLCGGATGEGMELWLNLVHKSFALEKSFRDKVAVIDLLKASFDAVKAALIAASPEELEKTRELFGEVTTYRRIYLRILAHAHEHMGQAIAYARSMGFHVPWPDPVKKMEEMVANAAAV